MTAMRLISLPVHGAVEMLLGFALMAAPFAVGASPAATLVGVVAGTLLVGLALTSTGGDLGGRGTLTIASHHAFDYGMATGLLGAAAIVGFAGDRTGAVLFAATAVGQLALNLTTRYSHR